MIWLWIIAALVLSKLALGKKKISPEHYIWMLLPIDMYGLDVAGVTLKPYMLFSVFLLWLIWRRRDARLVIHFDRRWSTFALMLLILSFGANVINTTAMSSVSSSLMLFVVFACTLIYISAIQPGTVSQIGDVILATAIGYGLVFMVSICMKWTLVYVEGVCTNYRMQPGIFLKFYNMVDGQLVTEHRLRGFLIDPNVLVCNFIYAIPLAIMNLSQKRKWFGSVLCLVLAAESIINSNSRMGMLCTAIISIVAVLIGYSTMTGRTRKWAIGLLSAAAVAIMAVGVFTDIYTNFFTELMGSYDNRSGLTDEFGRLTLWNDAMDVLLKNNPLLGVGLNQIMNYSATGKSTHNTWLEWICGSGFLIGGAICIYFLCALIAGIINIKKYRNTALHTVYTALLLGVAGTFIALVSVDNVTNSYLWFGTLVLTAMWTRFTPAGEETDRGDKNALPRTT